MNDLHLLEMTLTGAVMVTAIVLIRALFMHRLPKKTFLFLWGAALLRLLIPFSIPSGISIYTAIDSLTPGNEMFAQVQSEYGNHSEPFAQTEQLDMTAQSAQGSLAAWVKQPLPRPFEILWLSGLVLCALFFLAAYVWSRRRFRHSEPVSNPYLEDWAVGQGLRRRIQIRTSKSVSGPLTYGICRPVILLPSRIQNCLPDCGGAQLRFILTHESVHIRRFDALIKFLLTAAVCVHWFNPFCWILYILANRDLEISCDEEVLRILGRKEKTSYAKALVRMEEVKSGLSPLASHFNKSALEERVTAILKNRKASGTAAAASVMLVVMVAAVFGTSAAASGNRNRGGGTDAPTSEMAKQPASKGYDQPEDGTAASSTQQPPGQPEDGTTEQPASRAVKQPGSETERTDVTDETGETGEIGETGSSGGSDGSEGQTEEWHLVPGTPRFGSVSGQPDESGTEATEEWRLQPGTFGGGD